MILLIQMVRRHPAPHPASDNLQKPPARFRILQITLKKCRDRDAPPLSKPLKENEKIFDSPWHDTCVKADENTVRHGQHPGARP